MTEKVSQPKQIDEISSINSSNDEYINKYTFVYLLCFISFIVSISFYYLRKSMKKQNNSIYQPMEDNHPLYEIHSTEWNV